MTPAKIAANLIINLIAPRLRREGLRFEACPVPPGSLSTIVDRVHCGQMSNEEAKGAIDWAWRHGGALLEARSVPREMVAAAVRSAIERHPDQARAARENPRAVGWLVRAVLVSSVDKLDPKTIAQEIASQLR